jgi:DNA polymerase III alpha subunit
MTYQNYHRHSFYSNIITPDSVVSNEDYAKRAVELGHGIISTLEHGYCGHYIEGYELAEKYGLKFISGLESYMVKDRFEKDKTNAHIILLAKNENGRQAINDIVSEANLTGYYYRARIDLPLLFSLPKDDIWCTTACIAGIWKYEDADDIALRIAEHFGRNFFLEVQNHNTLSQIALNHRIINIANQNNLNIIFGCDSHIIRSEQSKDREDFLLSKKIIYDDEQGWNLDYPTDEEAYQRFINQGVLSKQQIKEAMDNTNIFLDVEKYDGNIFHKEIKMPTLYPDKTQEEKDKIFTDLICSQWEKEKINIPQEKWDHYNKEIEKEVDIVVATKHADYFLLNQKIIERGKELGGVITLSGRGSGVSFYINKLLGFTEVDRISASIKLYPERFMSKTRILETKSLADFDMNLANPEVFAQAQKDILGEECSYPMIAFGTMKPKAAFKMYARAKNIEFETANFISDQIGKYEDDLKHADEDEKESINVLDYIDKQYHELFLGSKKYLGIVSDVKIAPCGYIVYSGNIRKEIGLIRLNSANGTQHICAIMDGLWAENYKFLKNDLLKVSVVELIDNIYKRIGVKPHTVNELLKICEGNKKVWEVYKNGWTMGINQVEQHGTSSRATKYAPTNISELSAFVAAVRPGFASMYKIFENRESFSYGIESFDKLIQTPEMPMSFVLYQEQSMATLNYAGIPMTECYEIIKNIAKKRVEKVLKYKEIFIKGFSKKIVEDEGKTTKEAKELSDKVWKILEDSSNYSFNASHSLCVALDSLYGAYLKSHYPLEFYEVFMKILEDGGDKGRLAKTKEEAERAYHISFPKFSFGQDNRNIVGNSETKEITSSLKSITGFGGEIGENMFNLANNFQGEDFIDLMVFAEESKMFSSKFESLIKIDYFNQFGNNKKLLSAYTEFKSGKSRYNRNLKDATKGKRILELKEIFNALPNDRLLFMDQLIAEEEILGYLQLTIPKLNKMYIYILNLNTLFAPRIQMYCLANGHQASLKINRKTYDNNPFGAGEILFVKSIRKEDYTNRFIGNNQYLKDYSEPTYWLDYYEVIKEEQLNKVLNTLDKN